MKSLWGRTLSDLGFADFIKKWVYIAQKRGVKCNWALFDVIPALSGAVQGTGKIVEVAILEDLEKLRPMNRIGFLESIRLHETQLEGYYLYGEGLLPSYWWLDTHGNVAIFSSFFQTFVLKEIVGGSA